MTDHCQILDNQWSFLGLSHQQELCQQFKGCDESIIPWSQAYFCAGATSVFLQILFIVVWIYTCYLIFYLLGSTADFLFAPTLSQLSDRMRLPQRIAGVTFLAVGNGAPDISATVAAIRQGNYPLSFGALTGAAMFVSSVVAGNIIRLQTKRGVRAQGAMLRDVFFLLLTASYWCFVFYFGKVNMLYVGISLAVFVTFVTLTAFFDFWHHVLGRPLPESLSSFRVFKYEELEREILLENENENEEDEAAMNIDDNYESSRDTEDDSLSLLHKTAKEHRMETYMKGLEQYIGEDNDNYNYISPYNQQIDSYDTIPIPIDEIYNPNKSKTLFQTLQSMLASLAEEDYTEFLSVHFLLKIKMIAIFPIVFAERITSPVVTPENYHPVWLLLSCVFVFPFLTWWDPIGLQTSLLEYSYATIIGTIFSFLIYLFFIRKQTTPPREINSDDLTQLLEDAAKHETNNNPLINPTNFFQFSVWIVISILGFVATLAWIDILSSELVSIFTIGGWVLGWPQVLMGATLLAFGNSMGDFSANTSIANQGKVSMAITACYSGPLFNILIGLSIGFAIFIAEHGSVAIVHLPHVGFVGVSFMVVSGIVVFFASLFNRFKIPSFFGKVLMGIYAVYFVAIFPIAFLWK